MKKGITLIELMVVVSITLMLLGLSINAYVKLHQRQRLANVADIVKNLFRIAHRDSIDTCQRHYIVISPPNCQQTVTLLKNKEIIKIYQIPKDIVLWQQTFDDYDKTIPFITFFVQSGEFSDEDILFYLTDAEKYKISDNETRLIAYKNTNPNLQMFQIGEYGYTTNRYEQFTNKD